MKMELLSKEDYAIFQRSHNLANFLNAVETMDLEASLNLATHYIGIKENGCIIGACALVEMQVLKKFHYLYGPRGMLVDYQNKQHVEYLTKQIKAYAKSNGAIYVVIDPYVLYKERDIFGELVEGGFDHSYVVNNLQDVGFVHQGYSIGYGHNMQYIRWMFSMDLKDKTADTLLKDFHQQTRWSINKTLKLNIEVRALNYNELDQFHKIMEETSERRNFSNRNLEFYQKQFKAYGSNLKVYMASLNTTQYAKSIQKELEQAYKEQEELKELLLKNEQSKKYQKKLKVVEETIVNTKRKQEECIGIANTYGENVALAASMFVFQGNEVTYLTSGAYEAFRSFYASYALQWHTIKEALQHGVERYNFYGISGIFDPQDESYGVFKFKQGFGGQVEELVGDFVLPIRPILYKLYKLKNKGE